MKTFNMRQNGLVYQALADADRRGATYHAIELCSACTAALSAGEPIAIRYDIEGPGEFRLLHPGDGACDHVLAAYRQSSIVDIET